MPGTIGVLGGTFDPVHLGHLAAADDAAAALELDRVLFVPNRVPPHKLDHPVTTATDRLSMIQLAIRDNALFATSTVELDRDGPSYSLDTLRALRHRLGGDTRLVFLLGTDVLDQLHTWHEPGELLDQFEVVLMRRASSEEPAWLTAESHFPGIRDRLPVVEVAALEISAHDIRARVQAGLPYRYLVPELVYAYIREHRLYSRAAAR